MGGGSEVTGMALFRTAFHLFTSLAFSLIKCNLPVFRPPPS